MFSMSQLRLCSINYEWSDSDWPQSGFQGQWFNLRHALIATRENNEKGRRKEEKLMQGEGEKFKEYDGDEDMGT